MARGTYLETKICQTAATLNSPLRSFLLRDADVLTGRKNQ
jgi:hypothetical protein